MERRIRAVNNSMKIDCPHLNFNADPATVKKMLKNATIYVRIKLLAQEFDHIVFMQLTSLRKAANYA